MSVFILSFALKIAISWRWRKQKF